MEICISKNWGIQKVLSWIQFGCLSSHWQFVVCTLLMLYPCIKFWSNQTIGYGDIAFKRFGGYRKCSHECSCSSARRMSNFNGNIPQHSGGYLVLSTRGRTYYGAKWELMLSILTMNHLILNIIQICNRHFVLDQPSCYQAYMILVDETESNSYLYNFWWI